MLATQNPIEYEGTYPLPEAQLDRFLLRMGVGYPERDDELAVLDQRRERRTDDFELRTVVDSETLVAMQHALEDVHVAPSVGYYIVDVVRATRESRSVQVGASPRGSLAILKLARATRCSTAATSCSGRRQGDRRPRARAPALAQARALGARIRPEDVVQEQLETVPTPPAEDVRRPE